MGSKGLHHFRYRQKNDSSIPMALHHFLFIFPKLPLLFPVPSGWKYVADRLPRTGHILYTLMLFKPLSFRMPSIFSPGCFQIVIEVIDIHRLKRSIDCDILWAAFHALCTGSAWHCRNRIQNPPRSDNGLLFLWI